MIFIRDFISQHLTINDQSKMENASAPVEPAVVPNSEQQAQQPDKKEREDISGGYTKSNLINSYASGIVKHGKFKPRGKPSNVWDRGIYALYKTDDSIISNWYICKRTECNEFFNMKLSQGNKRLREHLAQHDKDDEKSEPSPSFTVTWEQFYKALNRANTLGDSHGLISFEDVLPKPKEMPIWLVFVRQICLFIMFPKFVLSLLYSICVYSSGMKIFSMVAKKWFARKKAYR